MVFNIQKLTESKTSSKEGGEIVVIKIGSSTLVDSNFRLRLKWLKNFVKNVAELHKEGKKVIVISSGAVAIGRKKITEHLHKLTLEQKQAAAAVGQPLLISKYSSLLEKHNLLAAQILLTIAEVKNRRTYLNARNTIETLLDNGIVPIINENDSVATEGLRVGDNDRLSALVAQMVGADKLIIFSDVSGLYTDDPGKNKDAKFIAEVAEIDKTIKKIAKGATSSTGTGGMKTKIDAAQIAMDSGCETIITSGKDLNSLINTLNQNNKQTRFLAADNPTNARKNWILNTISIKGIIIIDAGAEKAINNGNSLLPVGVTGVKGRFERGDVISVYSEKGKEIARGMTAYNHQDVKLIMGKQSNETEDILGYSGRENIIHADNMALL